MTRADRGTRPCRNAARAGQQPGYALAFFARSARPRRMFRALLRRRFKGRHAQRRCHNRLPCRAFRVARAGNLPARPSACRRSGDGCRACPGRALPEPAAPGRGARRAHRPLGRHCSFPVFFHGRCCFFPRPARGSRRGCGGFGPYRRAAPADNGFQPGTAGRGGPFSGGKHACPAGSCVLPPARERSGCRRRLDRSWPGWNRSSA